MGAAIGAGKAVPRYLQIAEDIIQQVRAGVLKPGDQVPSEAEMAERYGVSGGTVRKAMLEIRASGLVDTRHGKGSYVRDRPPVRHRSSDRFRRSLRQGGKAAYLAESEQSGATAKVSVIYGEGQRHLHRADRGPGSDCSATWRRARNPSTRTPSFVLPQRRSCGNGDVVPAVGRGARHPGTLRREPRRRRHLRPTRRARPHFRRVRGDPAGATCSEGGGIGAGAEPWRHRGSPAEERGHGCRPRRGGVRHPHGGRPVRFRVPHPRIRLIASPPTTRCDFTFTAG